MRPKTALTAGALLLVATIVATPAAQGPPPAAPAPAGGGRGGGQGRGPATFPAQQRPPGDPAKITRGKTLYDVNCRLCHGPDLRGGDMGGVNLLRSALVFNDQKGELIKPVVTAGRSNPGMPPMPAFPLPDADVEALAEFLHSVQATMRGQGNPPASATPPVLNLLVGNAQAGQAYFQAKCSSCHSATGDMAGIGSRITDVMTLQNSWVAGRAAGAGGRGGRGGGGGGGRGQTTATVTLANGQKFEGPVVRYDDFVIAITQTDGTTRSFRRTGDVPKVEIKDPGQAHISLLPTYTDKDIHDVTAYLVTLK